MLTAFEAGAVFALLEEPARCREPLEAFAAVYGAVREAWLVRALLAYHARSGSTRALDLLARAPEPHARHLLDTLQDQLRAERATRHRALAALAPLVARRPAWLHRLAVHPAARALMHAAQMEPESRPLLHALLALAALLPAAPALAAAAVAPGALAAALLRPDPSPALPALRLARLALFHALYAAQPVALLERLRNEVAAGASADGLRPLLASVRLHPALVEPRIAPPHPEPHDVLDECRRLDLTAPSPASPRPRSPPPAALTLAPRAPSALQPGAEPWFPLAERCGADSAPNTPLPAEADSAEPPEAAVEATPENTPARDARAQFRFPGEGSGGGAGAAYAARLARVAGERRAAASPISFGTAAAPAGLPRPEPRVALLPGSPAVAPAPMAHYSSEEEKEPPPVRDPRAMPIPGCRRARGRSPPHRPMSCPPQPPTRTHSVAVQTLDIWPEPYEFLIADFFRCPPSEIKLVNDEEEEGTGRPLADRVDEHINALYSGRGTPASASNGDLAEQLAIAQAQLAYERWRRDTHAERNRRLLGRCRRARALDLNNQALRDRLRDARRDIDELRARISREHPPLPPSAPATSPSPAAELEEALLSERAARHRAEAALHEERALRRRDADELQSARAAALDAARRLAAAAADEDAAERRATALRRLRRELRQLSGREEHALPPPPLPPAAAAATAVAATHTERALRAAVARAVADAEVANARAEAAVARAHELEEALAARESAAAELRRAARQSAAEAEARNAAVQDKYAALMRIVRTAEARRLDELAAAAPSSAATRPPILLPPRNADGDDDCDD